MKVTEESYFELRCLKDRLKDIIGKIDDSGQNLGKKANRNDLLKCADELREEADKLNHIIAHIG